MGYLIDILIGVISGIVTGELGAHAEPVARWIIQLAVRRLSSADRERFREEWLAHLEETPGMLRKVWHALGCYFCATKLANTCAERNVRPEKLEAFGALLLELHARYRANTSENRFTDLPPEERAEVEKILRAKINELSVGELKVIMRLQMSAEAAFVKGSKQPMQPQHPQGHP